MKNSWLALALLLPLAVTAGPIEQARALADEGDHDRAIASLEQSLNGRLDPRAVIMLTRLCNEAEDWERGIEYGEQAVGLAPNDSEAHFVYALALRTKMQKVSKMKAMFSLGTYKKELARAIELDPRNVEARSEEIGFLLNAPGFAGGNVSKAQDRIHDLEPLDWRGAMQFQAELYDKEKDPQAALVVYEKMVERDAEDLNARLNLAFMLQRAERYAEADRHFKKIADSDEPRWSMSARYQLARSRVLGQYEARQAVDYLLEYIERLDEPSPEMPSKSSAYWRLGMAYELLEQADSARRAYEKALALDSGNKQAKASLKKLGRG